MLQLFHFFLAEVYFFLHFDLQSSGLQFFISPLQHFFVSHFLFPLLQQPLAPTLFVVDLQHFFLLPSVFLSVTTAVDFSFVTDCATTVFEKTAIKAQKEIKTISFFIIKNLN